MTHAEVVQETLKRGVAIANQAGQDQEIAYQKATVIQHQFTDRTSRSQSMLAGNLQLEQVQQPHLKRPPLWVSAVVKHEMRSRL